MAGRYGLEIRAAAEADAPGLADLLKAAGRDIDPRVLAGRLGAVLGSGGTALVALEWGPPSGLVVLHACPTLAADLPVARITTLVVGPGERRRGIGRLLLKAAARAARVAGCGMLSIPVATGQDGLAPDGLASHGLASNGLAAFCRATGFVEAETGFVRPLRKGGAGAA